MIENDLVNYGILGLWTATLLFEKYKTQDQMKKVIKDNTEALIKLRLKLK